MTRWNTMLWKTLPSQSWWEENAELNTLKLSFAELKVNAKIYISESSFSWNFFSSNLKLKHKILVSKFPEMCIGKQFANLG